MIQIGEYNNLKVGRGSALGFFLVDELGEEVLLPIKYTPKPLNIGDTMEVFIYTDSEDRPIATTQTPIAIVNSFAFLKVVDIAKFGAFLDWGLDKDLLVPIKEQAKTMVLGKYYVVYITLDNSSQRLIASSKINSFLSNEEHELKFNEEVDLVVFEEVEFGYFVIINLKHKGLIYKNEIYTKVAVGDALTGYVKQIKEGNLIDVSLQKIGFENIDANSKYILGVLTQQGGTLNLHDNSTPDEIQKQLNMSKKTFKKAIGILYRQKLITISNSQIQLA
ncbi:MAG: S1-like domain-containing RNA-binding protein [Bacteroidota bacterium]